MKGEAIMKFGVELPTCAAGMMRPVPVDVAIETQQLGYTAAASELKVISG